MPSRAAQSILDKLPEPEVCVKRKDEIQQHPDNPRRGNVGLIYESIMENGWYGHVYVQKSTGNIFIGNHRFKAGTEAGMEEFPSLVYDVDDMTAKKLMLVDNRSADEADYDPDKLIGLLVEQAEEDPLLQGTGYGPNDLDDLIDEQETPLSYDEDRRLTTAERKLVYDSTTIRQIMLITDHRTYDWMVARLTELMHERELDTNTEVVISLLEEATGKELKLDEEEVTAE